MSDWAAAELEEAARARGAKRCVECHWLIEPTGKGLHAAGCRVAALELRVRFLEKRLEQLLAEHGQTL